MQNQMKDLVKAKPEPGLWMEYVPVPEPGPSDVPIPEDIPDVIAAIFNPFGNYGREIYETWYKMIALVQSGLDVSGLITHRIGINDFEDGFAAVISGNSGKVVMDWEDT